MKIAMNLRGLMSMIVAAVSLLVFSASPEASTPMGNRSVLEIAKSSAAFSSAPTFSVQAKKNIEPSEASQEIQLLKQEVKDLKSSQSDLLTTVYWALSVVGALAAALIGASWFTNFKLYERDIKDLRREIQTTLEIEKSSLKSLVKNEIEESDKKVRSKFGLIEYQLYQLRTQSSLDAKRFSVAITSGVQLLLSAAKLGDKNVAFVGRALELLERAVDGGGAFYEEEVAMLYSLRSEIPSELSERVDKLLSKVRSAKMIERAKDS